MIDRLLDSPLVVQASRVGAVFNRFPDEALDCDWRTWHLRVAGALIVHRDHQPRQPPSPA